MDLLKVDVQNTDLTVVMYGPLSSEMEIYIGKNKVGLIQNFNLELDASNFLPVIDISTVGIKYTPTDSLIINRPYIAVKLGSVSKSNTLNVASKVIFNDKLLGAVQRIKMQAMVTSNISKCTIEMVSFNATSQAVIDELKQVKWLNIYVKQTY